MVASRRLASVTHTQLRDDLAALTMSFHAVGYILPILVRGLLPGVLPRQLRVQPVLVSRRVASVTHTSSVMVNQRLPYLHIVRRIQQVLVVLHITWSNADTVESPAGDGTRRAAGVTHTYSAMVTSVDHLSSRSPM